MCCAEKLWSPNACIILAAMGNIITFSITYPLSDWDYHSCDNSLNYFLSSSIASPPESMIGAFGISISSIPLVHVAYLRYTFVKSVIPRMGECGRTNINEVLFWIGLLGIVGIIGVGSFQCLQITWAHYMFATIAFLSFNVYIVAQTWYVDRLCAKKDSMYRRSILRQIFAALSILSVILMLVNMFFTRDQRYPLLLESFFEVSMVVSFEAWILTLYNSFRPVVYYKLVPVTASELAVTEHRRHNEHHRERYINEQLSN